MANFLSPIFNEQTFYANGDPLLGGKLYTYQAGTSTAQATYTTQDGSTQQANPIILNARGEPDSPIWLAAGSEYKFILKDSNDVTLRTVDDIGGVNDISSAADQWVLYGVAPTYVSTTSFTVPGDQTNTFHVGRRLKTTNTGGTIYSRISASVYGSSTTVTVANDSGTLDSGLSAVSYGLLTATNPSLPNSSAVRQAMGLGYGTDIASAATLDLTARTGNIVRITGTTGPVTAMTLANGDMVMLEIVSTPTFNVSGVLSYLCSAGDNIFVWQDGNGTQGAFVYKKGQAPTFVDSPFDLSASVAGNALTITLKAGGWFFRSATLGTGTFEYVKSDSDLTLTISGGSTLGGVNAVQTEVLARVVNDAGTLRLTAENISGGMDASETGVISTTAEGGAGAADSASTIYSTTARTNVAYRVVGMVRSTQATAGTWATAPSLVQGAGGNALVAMMSAGNGQTWQTVTGSRAGSTTYYNTTGKEIKIQVSGVTAATTAFSISPTVNGVALASCNHFGNGAGYAAVASFSVPPGQSYSVAFSSCTLQTWSEER